MASTEIEGLVLREPTVSEWAAAGHRKPRPDIGMLVEKHGRVVGRGGVFLLPERDFAETARLWIEVSPRELRQGVGTLLLRSLVSRAREAGAGEILSTRLIPSASPAEAFARANGFSIGTLMNCWECGTDTTHDYFDAIFRRWDERGKIPSTARVAPLAEAPVDEVKELVGANMGFALEGLGARLEESEFGYSRSLSPVAWHGDQIVGATLVTFQKAFLTVEANAVVPAYRNSWVSVALKREVARLAKSRGVPRLRFLCNPAVHRDTEKTAQRLSGQLVSSQISYRLKL